MSRPERIRGLNTSFRQAGHTTGFQDSDLHREASLLPDENSLKVVATVPGELIKHSLATGLTWCFSARA